MDFHDAFGQVEKATNWRAQSSIFLGMQVKKHLPHLCLRFKADQHVFWTDSTCVRHWVRQTATFYKAFVSNRIGEIQTLTRPEKWHHLPGKMDVAYKATRSELEEGAPVISEQWINGSAFLYESEDKWPKDLVAESIAEELRHKWDFKAFAVRKQEDSWIARSGSWTHARRIAERVAHWCRRARKKMNAPGLEREDWNQGLVLLMRSAESEFEDDAEDIKAGKLRKTSRLRGFAPQIDETGLVRVGGRVERAPLPYDTRHPIILPPRNEVCAFLCTH